MSKKAKVITVTSIVILLLAGGILCAQPGSCNDMLREWVTVRLYVYGSGNFTAGPYSTAAGQTSGEFEDDERITFRAYPAEGWKFKCWVFNNVSGGSSLTTTCVAKNAQETIAAFEKIQ